MVQEEFIQQVQRYSQPEDLAQNKHLLNDVRGWQREVFLNCLSRGAKIPNAFNALRPISMIMDVSYLTHTEILKLLNTFTLLEKILFPSAD